MMYMGKIVGIISIKGGVGKTTTVANLAAVLAHDFQQKVLVIDANFSAPNIAYHLGIEDVHFSIHDVLTDKIPASEAIVAHHEGFDVLPSAMKASSINVFDLKKKISHLKDKYDVILLDSSPSLTDEIAATMVASDELYVVSSPDIPTLKCTVNAVKAAQKKKVPLKGIILNKVKHKSFEVSLEQLEQAAGIPVLAVLPDDDAVLEALSKTTTASVYKPRNDFSVEYKKLAGALINQEYQDPRIFSKLKNIFTKPGQQEINRIAQIKGL